MGSQLSIIINLSTPTISVHNVNYCFLKVVPFEVLTEDENFASYIRAVNDRLVFVLLR